MADPSNLLFTIDTLGDIDDGAVRLVVDHALAEALADCNARPFLEKARRLIIQVEIEPKVNERGGMTGVTAEVAVALKVPPRSVRPEYLRTTVKGDDVEAYLPSERAVPLFPDKKGPTSS